MPEMLPESMMAIGFDAPGGPEVLRSEHLPLPQPAVGEVLVKVAFAGVNRPDVAQRQGLYPPPAGASPIPGLEIAGTVVALGEGVMPELLGTQICALVAGGGTGDATIFLAEQLRHTNARVVHLDLSAASIAITTPLLP